MRSGSTGTAGPGETGAGEHGGSWAATRLTRALALHLNQINTTPSHILCDS